jgi:hypothetical protein
VDKTDSFQIEYRQAEPSDKEKIFDFYEKVYPSQSFHTIDLRWNWEYIMNPYNPDKYKIGIWLAIDKLSKEIIGQTGVIYEKFKLKNKLIIIAWGIDLIVHPAFRGKNIAFNLQKIMMESVDAYLNISMAYSTRVISKKLGAIELPQVTQLIYPVKVPPRRTFHYFILRTYAKNTLINKILRKILKSKPFVNLLLLSGLPQILSKKWYHLCRKEIVSTDSFSIRPYDHRTDSYHIDAIWNAYKYQFDNWSQRDYVNFCWKYLEEPKKNHSCFLVEEKNRVIGFFVLRVGDRFENNIGLIVDLIIDKSNYDAIKACIVFSKKYFLKKGVEYIYATVSDFAYLKIFFKCGYKSTRIHIPTFLTSRKDLISQLNLETRWFFSFTDHELNRYPVRGK